MSKHAEWMYGFSRKLNGGLWSPNSKRLDEAGDRIERLEEALATIRDGTLEPWTVEVASRALREMGMTVGPNHKTGCTGTDFKYSGYGYDRVRVCACGAEDHDAEPAREDKDVSVNVRKTVKLAKKLGFDY